MLLSDFAEALNGKLYIMGGGWTVVHGPSAVSAAVAINLRVPWTQTNQKHTILLELLKEDGEAVTDPEGNAIQVSGEFEMGRPVGSIPGDPITNAMAFRFEGLPLPSGGYAFSFGVDGTELARSPFRVFRPQEM
jgi:hypothetical protein